MIKISNIKIPADGSERDILSAAARIAGVNCADIKLEKILKYSVDSRKKPNVYKIYTAVFSAESGIKAKRRPNNRIYRKAVLIPLSRFKIGRAPFNRRPRPCGNNGGDDALRSGTEAHCN